MPTARLPGRFLHLHRIAANDEMEMDNATPMPPPAVSSPKPGNGAAWWIASVVLICVLCALWVTYGPGPEPLMAALGN